MADPEIPEAILGEIVTTPWNPGLSKDQVGALMNNLNPQRVASRTQSGQSLAYLEAYDVKATLIRVLGFAGFSADVIESAILDQREVENSKKTGTNWKVAAKATVRLTIHATGATYTETAVAGSSQPDLTEALDMALKSAESDALKRCATYLGTAFGLSLYNDGSTHDVVRVIVEPIQAAMLAEYRAERGGGNPEGQALVDRALAQKAEKA